MELDVSSDYSSLSLTSSPSASMFDCFDEREEGNKGHKLVKLPYAKMDLFTEVFSSDSSALDQVTAALDSMRQAVRTGSKEGLIEFAWILTHHVCVSKKMCHIAVDKEAITILMKIISEEPPSSQLKLQCIWALGNIAADCKTCKQRVRSTDFLKILGNTLKNEEFCDPEEMQVIIRSTLNVVRHGLVNTELNTHKQIVSACHGILVRFKNNQRLTSDALWCLLALARDVYAGRRTLTVAEQPGLLDRIIEIFMENNNDHQLACILILMKLLIVDDTYLHVLNHPHLYTLIRKGMMSRRREIRKVAVWLCSYIIRHDGDHIEHFLYDHYVFTCICQEACIPHDSASHSSYVHLLNCIEILTRMLSTANTDRFSWLLGAGILNTFSYLISYLNPNIAEKNLIRLINILIERPHYIGLINKLPVVESIDSFVLDNRPIMLELKEELENLLESNITNNQPYTFNFCPRQN